MDQAIRSNQARIYKLNYVNGSYGYSSTIIYDTYHNQEQGSGGLTGARGPTGPTGSSDSNDRSQMHYKVRTLNRKVYKAYKIEITPTHDTQESYDEVVVPFLDLDDIGVEIQLSPPRVTGVRLDVKPKFKDQVEEINAYNTRIIHYNDIISKIFNKVQSRFSQNESSSDEDIMNELQDDIKECSPEFKDGLDTTITDMINKLRSYYSNRSEDPYYSDDDYDHCPYAGSYMKPHQYISDEWYDYRYDVCLNDSTKLHLKCHEGTKTYQLVNNLAIARIEICSLRTNGLFSHKEPYL